MGTENWKRITLGEALDVLAGGAWGSADEPNGTPVLRTNNIRAASVLDLTAFAERSVPSRVVQRLGMRDGDILMTKSNSIDRVGECGLFLQPTAERRTFIPSNFCQLMRFRSTVIDPWFGLFWLRHGDTQKQIKDSALGTSSSLKNVSAKKLRELSIIFPPLDEQRRLVNLINECIGRIEEIELLTKAAQTELAALEAAAFQDALDTLPERDRPLTALGTLVVDSQYGTSKKSSNDGSGFPMLRMGNIQSGHLDFSAIKYVNLDRSEMAKYLLQEGDLLVNRTNSLELVGKAGVVENLPKGEWVFASYLIRFRLDTARVLPQFACAVLNGRIGRDYILRTARRAIGMVNINAKEIRALEIPLPTLDRQRVIVAALREARDATIGIGAQMDVPALHSLQQSILRHAFAGEL